MTEKIYKICIVGNSLNSGGAEKAHSNLSIFFHKKNIEVHNIIFENNLGYPYKGQLFNYAEIPHKTYFQKIIRYKKMYDYIRKNRFDYVIDMRSRGGFRSEYFLVRFIFGQTKYIPSVRGFSFRHYFTDNTFVANKIDQKSYKIITVSRELSLEIQKKYGYTNLQTIYNMVDIDLIKKLAQEKTTIKTNLPYIISLGRMAKNNIKQQDVIIRAYSKSILPQKGINLLLVGSGEKVNDFRKLVNELNLSDKIIFIGFQKNPFPYLKNAKFMVLASQTEGFPNVILESFACEVPVVSYDCQTGPKEIIENRKNGLLVENQNAEKLTEAMNLMAENEELYTICKSSTLKTALRFSPEIIGNQWLELMKIKNN